MSNWYATKKRAVAQIFLLARLRKKELMGTQRFRFPVKFKRRRITLPELLRIGLNKFTKLQEQPNDDNCQRDAYDEANKSKAPEKSVST